MDDRPSNHDSNDDTRIARGVGSPPRAPRWVKVFGIITLVLIVLVVALVLFGPDSFGPGQHGPGRHIPGGGGGPSPIEQKP